MKARRKGSAVCASANVTVEAGWEGLVAARPILSLQLCVASKKPESMQMNTDCRMYLATLAKL